ncbi:MAG: hypothetical protein ICV54_27635 [Nostoc sp. C3-bin3]|nr:hypothetical protein [Nostoc sp. C3-bin3]
MISNTSNYTVILIPKVIIYYLVIENKFDEIKDLNPDFRFQNSRCGNLVAGCYPRVTKPFLAVFLKCLVSGAVQFAIA